MIKSKIIIGIIVSLIIISCSSSKKYGSNIQEENRIDVITQANSLRDSLLSARIDTVLIYYNGCSGCSAWVLRSAYVFWKEKTETKVIKITNHNNKRQIASVNDVFNYYNSHKSEITNEDLVLGVGLLHENYTKVILWYDGLNQFEKQISDFDRTDENAEKKLMSWIYLIESRLFSVERKSSWTAIPTAKSKKGRP